MDIADLHCDLLSYLANHDARSVLDHEVRCSLPQLKKGESLLSNIGRLYGDQ